LVVLKVNNLFPEIQEVTDLYLELLFLFLYKCQYLILEIDSYMMFYPTIIRKPKKTL
jgi:hypothetical protein